MNNGGEEIGKIGNKGQNIRFTIFVKVVWGIRFAELNGDWNKRKFSIVEG